MPYHPDDTICAIATAPGGAGRGIIRVSGPDALAVAAPIFRTNDGSPFEAPRHATAVAGNLHIPIVELSVDSAHPSLAAHVASAGSIVPCDLFVWPTNRSYTREPVVELHTLGSGPILELILAAVCRSGARLAEPGEFTLRAFLAGRIDLTQAEAVLGVIDAGRAGELDTALAQLAGGLARPLRALRDNLLQLLAELEAGLDFVEEDIEFISRREVLARLASASQVLSDVSSQLMARQVTASESEIALIGPPNAGKSSLFNALTKRLGLRRNGGCEVAPAALVSPTSGTTRDYLTAEITLGGKHCELIDTAGIVPGEVASSGGLPQTRSAGGDPGIDQVAAELGRERSNRATIRVLCLDASQLLDKESRDVLQPQNIPACDVLVFTKSDLVERPTRAHDISCPVPTVVTSSRTGEGLDELSDVLCGVLADIESPQRYAVASTADRCRESIRRAGDALTNARDLAEHDQGGELIAADIRSALDELGKVVGTIYTEDLLDRIFSSFCIGK